MFASAKELFRPPREDRDCTAISTLSNGPIGIKNGTRRVEENWTKSGTFMGD
jgi:hypothetical protein